MHRASSRVAWVAASAFLALLPRAAGPEETGPSPSLRTFHTRPVISLAWFDPTGVLPIPAERVALEVQSLFASWDVDVRWRKAEAGVTIVEPPEVSVVIQPRARPGRPDILGEVEEGQGSRAAWVNVAGVMRALGMQGAPGRALKGQEAEEFARALSRVVSHEIVHLAAPDLPHTRDGLMRARFSRHDLVAEAPRLDAIGSHTFRLRLALFARGAAAA
jgi:hypothetical protein